LEAYTENTMTAREKCIRIFKAGVAAVQPGHLIAQHLRLAGDRLQAGPVQVDLGGEARLSLAGAGKASAAMAHATENVLGSWISEGLVVTKYQHALPLHFTRCLEAAHPVPDQHSLDATAQTLLLLRKARPGDTILILLSGGASSLWADCPGSVSLDEMQTCFELLLASGADIHEMNTVRKHLSAVKGGQLLRAAPQATWISLIISDVPGNNLESIASGPTAADPTSFNDAEQVLRKYNLLEKLPAGIVNHIREGTRGKRPETLKPGDPIFRNVYNQVIGSNEMAMEAARKEAEKAGYITSLLPPLQGDVSIAAHEIFTQCLLQQGKGPFCLIAGGETTVRHSGGGKGGRNQHLALLFLKEMLENPARKKITLLSAGTDGTDGPTDAAGAVVDSEVLTVAMADPNRVHDHLTRNDSYPFFEMAKGLVKTGPTQTNVMDLCIALVE